MGRLIDIENIDYVRLEDSLHCLEHHKGDEVECVICAPTVEAIPKDNVYKAIQEMMKYEHEGFINISLARLDEILKKCGVSEDGNVV